MLNRRAFIGAVGKLAALAGLAPVVKAGEAKEAVPEQGVYPFDYREPKWETQYLLEPEGEHTMDTCRFVLPPRHGKTLMCENQLRKEIGLAPRYE